MPHARLAAALWAARAADAPPRGRRLNERDTLRSRARPPMRLLLHVDDHDGPPRLVHLEAGRSYVLGRGPGVADIHIREHHVSRRHCLLRCGDRSAWLCDLGSDNGTRVDGEHLGPQGRLLVPDDVIHIAGNPVRLAAVVPLDPAWLAGNGGSVVQMARLIDQEDDYTALPILADALEDAGCDD